LGIGFLDIFETILGRTIKRAGTYAARSLKRISRSAFPILSDFQGPRTPGSILLSYAAIGLLQGVNNGLDSAFQDSSAAHVMIMYEYLFGLAATVESAS
jgi:hypothetical protein